MLKIFLYNLLSFFLIVGLALSNRDDPNVNNDWGIPQEEEITSSTKESSVDEVWQMIESGNYNLSREILLKLVNTNEKYIEAWNLLGYIERQIQNFEKSLDYYNKALSLNNDYIPAHHYIAMAYIELDNIDKAKYHLDKIDLLCLFGCEEFYSLKNEIIMYEKNRK